MHLLMFKPDVSCLDEGLDICNALAWLCWTVMDSALWDLTLLFAENLKILK